MYKYERKRFFYITIKKFSEKIKSYSHIKSLMFVPGNQEKMLKKSLGISSHVISPDLEDSVPHSEKNNARKIVTQYIPEIKGDRKVLLMPRLNSLQSKLLIGDLEYLLNEKTSTFLDGFVIPKVSSPEEYEYIENLVSEKEKHLGLAMFRLKLIIWIETTLGLVNSKEIFKLNSKLNSRLVAACFGAEDYCNDLGIERTENLKEIEYARSLFAMTANAFNILSIDTPNVDFKDPNSLIQEINYVKSLGFKGKFAIHPSQVEIININFSPSSEEIAWARKIIEEYEKALKEGKGTISIDGKMVDVPVYKRALNVIKRSYN
jgi:citrate lyase subunit beta/citryl-CoA lyase